MSLKQRVRLGYELDGEEKEVVVEYSAIDLRAWETAFNQSSLVADLSVAMLTWLGHHAAVRTGVINGELKTYKAFDEACFDVEGVRDEPSPTKRGGRATPKTPGDASSAR